MKLSIQPVTVISMYSVYFACHTAVAVLTVQLVVLCVDVFVQDFLFSVFVSLSVKNFLRWVFRRLSLKWNFARENWMLLFCVCCYSKLLVSCGVFGILDINCLQAFIQLSRYILFFHNWIINRPTDEFKQIFYMPK